MRMIDIKAIARERGIKPGKMTKPELIRAIQRQEGNIVCYREKTECDQQGCCWRTSCLPKQ